MGLSTHARHEIQGLLSPKRRREKRPMSRSYGKAARLQTPVLLMPTSTYVCVVRSPLFTWARTIPIKTWCESDQTNDVDWVSASGLVIGMSKFSGSAESGAGFAKEKGSGV